MKTSTMTRRQEHANNLSIIAEITNEAYYRRLSFQEADDWLNAFDCETAEGYPVDVAISRCWDYLFAGRGRFNSRWS